MFLYKRADKARSIINRVIDSYGDKVNNAMDYKHNIHPGHVSDVYTTTDINGVESIRNVDYDFGRRVKDDESYLHFINSEKDPHKSKVAKMLKGHLAKTTNVRKYEKMWEDYAKHMSRKRPDSVLERENFVRHVVRQGGDDAIVDIPGKASFLVNRVKLPELKHDVIIPSHFAPKGLRSGAEAVKELRKKRHVIYAVPDDLHSMLKRTGYYTDNFEFEVPFRGDYTKKKLAFSNQGLKDTLTERILTEAQNTRGFSDNPFAVGKSTLMHFIDNANSGTKIPTLKDIRVKGREKAYADARSLDNNEAYIKSNAAVSYLEHRHPKYKQDYWYW